MPPGLTIWPASRQRAVRVASIGIGGKGDGDCDQAAKHANLIAICDIDDERLDKIGGEKHPKAEQFNADFRKMFDELGKQIDAVTVSTPDHTHAVATMMAIKMGKARLHAKAADARRVGGPAASAGRQRVQSRHADGQPGHLPRPISARASR